MKAERRMKLVIIVQVDSIGGGRSLGIQKLQRHNRHLLNGKEKGYSLINSNTQSKTDRVARRKEQQTTRNQPWKFISADWLTPPN